MSANPLQASCKTKMNIMKNARSAFKLMLSFILLYLLLPAFAFPQNYIRGTVSNESTGEKIQGAVVSVENSLVNTVTDAEGNFTLSNVKNDLVGIHVSHLAYGKFFAVVKPSESPIPIRLKPKTFLADEVNIIATRANDKSAMAYTGLQKNDIEKQNLGADLPYLLNLLPSVTVTSDAGNGVGYTAIRIRGSDATRVNVTINGIPVNDAEGQLVYWVDLPDFASSVDNIQVQRGVGTSTNGAGAFGGSVNIQSSKLSAEPFAAINSSFGSFNTVKNTVCFGTGLINKFAFEGRLSKITSDGYIDRATSDLKSFYVSGGYYGSKSSLRMIVFSGREKTYQAWYGVPQDSLETNRTFNPAGAYFDSNGGVHYYDNQTDNYQQDYYQLIGSTAVNANLNLNAALHYTKGKGYYEEYEAANDPYGQGLLSTYGLDTIFKGTDTIVATNLIRQRWLDNDFYGFTFSANYTKEKLKLTLGGAGNQYKGKHFDEITWMENNFGTPDPYRYDENDATKNDFNLFTKINYDFTSRFNAYVDLQWRHVTYSFFGFNSDFTNGQQQINLSFFNPKAGVSYAIDRHQLLYASIGIGNKEPVRDDYVSSTPISRPKPERLEDAEAGYKFRSEKIAFAINYYFMNYDDQLILTGKINDVGAYIRQNVDKSYRTGAELEFSWVPVNRVAINGNITVSENKIRTFYNYVDDYDNGGQLIETLYNTDIAFSPSVISSLALSVLPVKNLTVALVTKYVGKQFLDNTSDDQKKLNAYMTQDIRLNYSFRVAHGNEIGITFLVNNIFDRLYESNGYTYSYLSGGTILNSNYYYPQAGTNWLGGVSLKF